MDPPAQIIPLLLPVAGGIIPKTSGMRMVLFKRTEAPLEKKNKTASLDGCRPLSAG